MSEARAQARARFANQALLDGRASDPSAKIRVYLRLILPSLCLVPLWLSSKNKLHLPEQIEQRLARINDFLVRGAKVTKVRRTITCRRRVDIAKAAARFQSRRTEGHRHVVN